MRKSLLFTAFSFAAIAAGAQTVTIQDGDLVGGQTYNWTADTEYLLDGFVFLEADGVLNIAPGTVIKAMETPSTSDNASALIITRGAQIFAEGTQAEPIIFTSELDDVTDNSDLDETDNGLWGGLVILGNGNIASSAPEGNIEGIPTSEPRGFYGGTDDNDNSGVVQYVSIRHGGAALSTGNEINGLTLGAVGSQTVIENVEVFANFDDGIEWFGGTANCKWCITAFCGDDAFDFDEGWRGKGQFWLTVQRSDSGDNGGEHDGANPDGATPFSNPTIYNATYIGSGIGATAGNATALLFRDATGGTYANSIFTEYANHGIEVEDLPAASGVDSRQRMEDGDLVLANNIWWEFGAGNTLDTAGFIRATADADDEAADFLITHLAGNNNSVEDPQLISISRAADGMLRPFPEAGSPAWSNLADLPAGDAFYTDVNYRGAFGSENWAAGWTALSAYGYIGDPTGINNQTPVYSTAFPVVPNPASTQATVRFQTEVAGSVELRMFDLSGRLVYDLSSTQQVSAGEHMINLQVADLAEGIYHYELIVANERHVGRISIVR